MQDYSFIISLMTWSFSRVSLYRTCPYAWFSKYIGREEGISNFFSEYGVFLHGLIADFYANKIDRDIMLIEYITGFDKNVVSKVRAKTFEKMRENYYEAGLNFIKNFEPFDFKSIIGIEKEIEFEIEGYKFTGYIDLVGILQDDEIEIIDNKSKDLKPRSKRKSPTKTDEELDEYLTQLYLYSIAIYNEYKKYPKYLTFNCFKNGQIIREEFSLEKLEEAKDWAIRTIKTIESNEIWNPHLDYYFCNNLCNSRNTCEYLETER